MTEPDVDQAVPAPMCAEGDAINDDNPGRPICRTCDDDPGVSILYP